MSLRSILDQGLDQLGLDVGDAKRQKLIDYIHLLVKWNKIHNLTAVRDPEEMITLHLLDSLAVMPHLQAKRLLDVGSGAGLPGIPLAICLPELQVTVMDSSQKKTSFMRQAKAELALDNLEVVCGRVEDYQPDAPFDTITSRAFSELALFVKLTNHLGAEGGQWLAMKGVYPQEELDKLDIVPSKVLPLQVPGLQAQRHLVVLPFKQNTKVA
jgi:16S rRNA (guanine527-N7)-methyltransferase